MADDEQHLRGKARLLLQRERELFELRKKHEQLAIWLGIGQGLPELFLMFLHRSITLDELWNRIRKTLITKLRLQRVILLEISDVIRPLAPTGPQRALPADVLALLDTQDGGICNDSGADSNPPGVGALAETVNLNRFMWSRIVRNSESTILIAGGFDQAKARFQSPFEETDAAHFNNVAQHLESLLANALLVAELEKEKEQLRQVNVSLEQRDRALQTATDELQAANESLEQRVRERTLELAEKNRDLRLVLDNVDNALFTIDLHGHLAPERSRAFDDWFGAYTGSPLFVEHVAVAPDFKALFELGLEAFRDGFLPSELCLAQMPARLAIDQRQFDCRYLPIGNDDDLTGLLLVVEDVTERLLRAREDAEQRELLAAFTALTRDRKGFLSFFEESERMFTELTRKGIDRPSQKRLLHTLKGNAASFGLHVVADLCHQVESELADAPMLEPGSLQQILTRWLAVMETIRNVVPSELRQTVEISQGELEGLIEQAQSGVSGQKLAIALQHLRWEPVERPLARLAEYARSLAGRLGKCTLEVQVDADRVRIDPQRWAPLWSALVHFVRNAIDHGMGTPEQRLLAGKPAIGRLRLCVRMVELAVVAEVEDDGRGIDWESVRRACRERGLASESQSDLVNAILSPGFSTRRQATETSGRGVGLTAAASMVRDLEGVLAVESQPGEGTRWTLTFARSGVVSASVLPPHSLPPADPATPGVIWNST